MSNNLLKVKSELRLLKHLNYVINSQMEVKERHSQRLELLKATEQTKSVKDDILRLEGLLSKLNIEDNIIKATKLENKYVEAINSLGGLDKTIITDAYINGKAYWKIGNEIGYSERGIQKRVSIALKKIADYVK